MTFDIDTIATDGQSATATVCEHAALFGATPERDEFDTRDVWDADEALCAMQEAFGLLADAVAPDGFQIADERESLLWGFVNMLDAQTQRLDRAADKLMPELRDLQREQDGTEIKSFELELKTDRAQNLTARRDAFETLRDAAAESYRDVTGTTWRPRRGSHASQTGKLTSAAIDARDYIRAKKDRKTQAHLPQGSRRRVFRFATFFPRTVLRRHRGLRAIGIWRLPVRRFVRRRVRARIVGLSRQRHEIELALPGRRLRRRAGIVGGEDLVQARRLRDRDPVAVGPFGTASRFRPIAIARNEPLRRLRPGDVFEPDGGDREGAGELEIA